MASKLVNSYLATDLTIELPSGTYLLTDSPHPDALAESVKYLVNIEAAGTGTITYRCRVCEGLDDSEVRLGDFQG